MIAAQADKKKGEKRNQLCLQNPRHSEERSKNMDKSNHAIIDVHNLEASMKEKFHTLLPLSRECCIYKVLPRTRKLDEKLYTPQIVSIGPIHHGKEELQAMEEHKWRYLKDFLQRTQVSMTDFLVLIKNRESQLRDCYAETIKLGSNEFVEMVLVDAAFIIELLLRRRQIFYEGLDIRVDRILKKPMMIKDIVPDLFMLENQLPMFILRDLFELARSGIYAYHVDELSMVKLISELWSWTNICKYLSIEEELIEKHFYEAQHFVDLLRLCLNPPEMQATELKTLTTPDVTKLHQAGVKFKIGSGKRLLDIRFEKGVLEIPNLKIVDETEGLLRNLQIFEQLHYNTNYVNDYITMMNFLVNTPNDAQLLIQNKIIESWLGNSEAVSSIFHSLIKENRMYPWKFYYTGLVEDLNAYCKSPWHKWKTNLKQNYFNSPWASTSVIAASVLLCFSFIQTVCSILQTIYSVKK